MSSSYVRASAGGAEDVRSTYATSYRTSYPSKPLMKYGKLYPSMESEHERDRGSPLSSPTKSHRAGGGSGYDRNLQSFKASPSRLERTELPSSACLSPSTHRRILDGEDDMAHSVSLTHATYQRPTTAPHSPTFSHPKTQSGFVANFGSLSITGTSLGSPKKEAFPKESSSPGRRSQGSDFTTTYREAHSPGRLERSMGRRASPAKGPSSPSSPSKSGVGAASGFLANSMTTLSPVSGRRAGMEEHFSMSSALSPKRDDPKTAYQLSISQKYPTRKPFRITEEDDLCRSYHGFEEGRGVMAPTVTKSRYDEMELPRLFPTAAESVYKGPCTPYETEPPRKDGDDPRRGIHPAVLERIRRGDPQQYDRLQMDPTGRPATTFRSTSHAMHTKEVLTAPSPSVVAPHSTSLIAARSSPHGKGPSGFAISGHSTAHLLAASSPSSSSPLSSSSPVETRRPSTSHVSSTMRSSFTRDAITPRHPSSYADSVADAKMTQFRSGFTRAVPAPLLPMGGKSIRSEEMSGIHPTVARAMSLREPPK